MEEQPDLSACPLACRVQGSLGRDAFGDGEVASSKFCMLGPLCPILVFGFTAKYLAIERRNVGHLSHILFL